MKYFLFFIQELGIIFLATLFHEVYNASQGTIEEVGIQFGSNGGTFVQGIGLPNETPAWWITGIVFVGCNLLIFIYGKRKKLLHMP